MDATNNEILNITKERRFLKSLYFVMFLAFGSISPFAMIFFKRVLTNPDGSVAVGLIGLVVASSPIVGFIANIAVGVLSDKLGIARKLITVLSFVGAVMAIIVGLCGEAPVVGLPLEQKFTLLFLAVLAYNFAIISLEPLVTSETLQHLNKHSDRKKFGTIRIFGTYGWAIAALLMGILLTITANVGTLNGAENYRIVYYAGAIAMLVLGILGIKTKTASIKKPKILYSVIFKDTRFFRFLIFVFLEGIIMTGTGSYLAYFFDDVMKSPLQIGLVFCFWTTFEIPVLAYSDKLLKKFESKKLLLAGMLFYMLELFLFSLFTLETPFYLKFLATLMHGLAFSLHYIALMDYLDRYAHKDMKTTYLASMNIARTTLATVAGGAIGALVIANFGSTMLMRGGAIGIAFLAVFFVLFVKKPRE
jgi:PPP family 3-phenylpropionic acid transporter